MRDTRVREKVFYAVAPDANIGQVRFMKLKIIVHQAEEGGYWAEVPAIAGCVSQGESLEDLMRNVREAVEGCLSVDVLDIPILDTDRVIEIAV